MEEVLWFVLKVDILTCVPDLHDPLHLHVDPLVRVHLAVLPGGTKGHSSAGTSAYNCRPNEQTACCCAFLSFYQGI